MKCLLLSAQLSITAELTAANGREKRFSLKVGVLVFLISFCYRNENEKREKNKLKAKNGSNLNWVEPDSWLELDSDSNLARNLQCVLSDKLWCYTGISSPEKSRNNTREKIRYFFTCVWYRQSAADTSLAFRTTRSGWWMNGKAFTILNPRPLSEHFRIMATKKIKNAYHLQTVTFELSEKGKRTKIRKEKPKVTFSMALVVAFLAAKNKTWQLEDLPQADFNHEPERFFLSVRTNSKTENFVYWNLGPMFAFVVIQLVFLSWVRQRTLPFLFGDCRSFHFHSLIRRVFLSVKGYCVHMITKIIHGWLHLWDSISCSYRVKHLKRNSLSTRAYVLFCI